MTATSEWHTSASLGFDNDSEPNREDDDSHRLNFG
jgi:hypothetical protein